MVCTTQRRKNEREYVNADAKTKEKMANAKWGGGGEGNRSAEGALRGPDAGGRNARSERRPLSFAWEAVSSRRSVALPSRD